MEQVADDCERIAQDVGAIIDGLPRDTTGEPCPAGVELEVVSPRRGRSANPTPPAAALLYTPVDPRDRMHSIQIAGPLSRKRIGHVGYNDLA
jgi:hypothetical protein